VIAFARKDGRARLYQGDSRDLSQIPTASVGVILTSPPYWVSDSRRASADRYARRLAVGFGREWRRVLARDGDLWLVVGDRHNGREWIGFDALVTAWLRRTGWRLQSKGIWAETRSRERWDNRINYLLRFRKAGSRVRPTGATLCWMLPLPRTHPESIWDATPEPVLRALLLASRARGTVLDPFCGAGTVGEVALDTGRRWVGVERDPRMARLTARRLGMRRCRRGEILTRPRARE
jgi:site-specific DNA-methyltransferase (adenine-specific)